MSQPTVLPPDAIEVGRVIEAYGVKGGLKLQPFSSTADGLLKVKEWVFKTPAGTLSRAMVVLAKWHGDVITATLEGIDDRDQAHALKGASVWVSPAALPRTAANEYYWRDLIGCTAIAQDGLALGSVTALSETGVHAVLHVDCGAQFEPVLIPFVAAFVGEVDVVAKTVLTQWQRDWLEPALEAPVKSAGKKTHTNNTPTVKTVLNKA